MKLSQYLIWTKNIHTKKFRLPKQLGRPYTNTTWANLIMTACPHFLDCFSSVQLKLIDLQIFNSQLKFPLRDSFMKKFQANNAAPTAGSTWF